MLNAQIKKIWDYNVSTGKIIPEEPKRPKEWATDQEGRRVLYQHHGVKDGSGYWDVHHIDENHKNNTISNLLVLHRDSHNEIHNS